MKYYDELEQAYYENSERKSKMSAFKKMLLVNIIWVVLLSVLIYFK